MRRLITRHWWLGLLGLVWLGTAGEGRAWWDYPPVKIDTVFQFHFNVKVGPEIQRPTAPWYAYFPADPNMLASPQITPYPTWPMQFPPPGPPADPRGDVLRKTSAQTYAPNGAMPAAYWPNYHAYGSNVRPVSYAPMQAPSYWYQPR